MTVVVTHNGRFHTDDICAVATLQLALGKTDVVRTRDKGRITQADYVVDVGNIYDHDTHRYDHHQRGGAGARENGIPYAAFGLVWKHYGEEVCGSQEVADYIDTFFVQHIDARDNGVSLMKSVRDDISLFNVSMLPEFFIPTWKETDVDADERFVMLVGVMQVFIKRMIVYARDALEGRKKVQEAYARADDKRVVVLDAAYPFLYELSDKEEVQFVVYPSNNAWHAKTMRVSPDEFESRAYFPESWGGLTEEDLARESGVDDALFCHTNRFLAVARTKEGVLELVQKALT